MSEQSHLSTHPLLPPTTEDDRISWLCLLRSRRVGPTTFHRLMVEHGNAAAALDALPAIAKSAGVSGYTPCPTAAAKAELKTAHDAGARMICIGETDYPTLLQSLSDAPPILWVKGDMSVLNRPSIAIVGARNASSLGLRMARALAEDLAAKGFVIVSGLARGVDTAAHKATVQSGTIAVLAGGVDVMYPAENTHLAQDISQTGLLISEQPMGMVPQARHFPRRNRIISGMSGGVVVVEAAAKSGSLITARTALDQGREVLAVPGHPFDARASGCNMLIRDGAVLVRNADDVTEVVPVHTPVSVQPRLPLDNIVTQPQQEQEPQSQSSSRHSLRDIAALHSQILNRLGPSPLAEDQLIRDLSIPAENITPALVDLELDGRVTRHPGGLLSLNN